MCIGPSSILAGGGGGASAPSSSAHSTIPRKSTTLPVTSPNHCFWRNKIYHTDTTHMIYDTLYNTDTLSSRVWRNHEVIFVGRKQSIDTFAEIRSKGRMRRCCIRGAGLPCGFKW